MTGAQPLPPPDDEPGGETALDRSLPLTRLPGLVAHRGEPSMATVLEGVRLPRLPSRVIDEVLRPAIGPVVERVVHELDDRAPVSVKGGDLEQDIRAAVDLGLRQFAMVVETGHVEIETTLYRQLGRRHAQSGLPLQELTARFAQSGLACWRAVLQLGEDGALPEDELMATSEAVYAFVQELSAAAVEGFVEAVTSSGTAVRSRRVELLRRLVSGEATEAEVRRGAEDAGWPLPERLVAVLAVAGPGDGGVPALDPWVLGAPHGAHWCLLVPAEADRRVRLPSVEPGSTLLVGPEVPWAQAGVSLRDAEDLLGLLQDGLVPRREVLWSGDHATTLLLWQRPQLARELAWTQLGPLLELPESRRRPLLDTLGVWLQRPGHHTALAAELHVHARSVRYRVDRLRVLLGDVVDDPERRLDLALAVRAVRGGFAG